MYAGIDIGGTKTLVAALDQNGVVVEKVKFLTSPKYLEFLEQLKETSNSLKTRDFKAGCVAIPGKVDRKKGIAQYLGNLPWQNEPIQKDLEQIFRCPIIVENDANLGGLSESMLLPKDQRILYVTISTGIGTGFIIHQTIDEDMSNSEGGHMLLEYHNKRVYWEDFASGKAIVKRFGAKAADITDPQIWRRIAHDISLGLVELMAISQPDTIIIGGSVSRYFDRFKDFLLEALKEYNNPLVPIPTITAASRADDAVIYGCYDLAHERYGKVN